jgi:hypothetical protein
MNNYMYRLLNAHIRVIYVGVSVHICVNCVVGHSVKREI